MDLINNFFMKNILNIETAKRQNSIEEKATNSLFNSYKEFRKAAA